QDHNNQCQQYGNDTVCIPVIAEGVDRTTIRATHSPSISTTRCKPVIPENQPITAHASGTIPF
ncbi:hypothetical protein, partial [Escherichia coli]|uniref:hypothetical protein n=1 Tax=Escherichia coli TaxID=562 RepID=UPI003984B7FF